MTEQETDTAQSLADLIREHQDVTGDSYGDIARLTGLSKAKVGQLVKPEAVYLVRHETVTKLATGLRLPRITVERAAIVTAGFGDAVQSNRVRDIADRLELLPEDMVDLAADFIETLERRAGTAARPMRSRRRGGTARADRS